MKKLLSLLMAAALLLGLGATALAYEDLEPPLWQRWGYESLEEYLADYDETEEEYAQEVADYIAERAEQDALIASFDPETHDFTPALWEYYGFESKEEMMELWEIDEAGYDEAVDDELRYYEQRDWTDEQWEAYWAEQEQAMIEETKTALGLIYDVNIIADGAALEFTPESAPVIRNSCTMMRLGDIAQALHAEAAWDADAGKITVTRGNTAVEMTVNDMILSFRTEGPDDNAGGGIFYLDSLPYVEGEEVYVPLRAVAEALGYDVEWSDTYRTAVLVDVETLVAQLDANYTVLNAMFAMNSAIDLTRSYESEGKLDIQVKVPMLGSAASYSGSVTADMVQSGFAAQGTVTYDMDELMGLLALAGESADAAEMDALTAAMDDGLELIYDMENMRIYLKGQLFSMLFEQEETEADTWFVMDMGELMNGMDAETLGELSEGAVSIGQMICSIAVGQDMDPIFLQEALDEMAEVFEPFSDSHFTGEGNVKSITYAPEDFEGFTMTLNVTMDGGEATAITGAFAFGEDGAKFDCTFDTQLMSSFMAGSILVEDTLQIDFNLTAVSEAVEDVDVPSAPPAGANVIDLFSMLMSDSFVEEVENLEALLSA